MIERGLDSKYKFRFDFKASITVNRSIPAMIRFVYYLATSDIILIDDYYPDIYLVDYPKNVKVLQVWLRLRSVQVIGLERLGKPGAPPFNTRCISAIPMFL